MTLKKVATSSKFFIVTLVLALSLLIFIGSTSFKQIKQLKEAASNVTQTLAVEKEINSLFSHYATMQSKTFESILRTDSLDTSSFKKFKKQSDSIFNNLNVLTTTNPTQQKILQETAQTKEAFYSSLKTLFETQKNSTQPSVNWTNTVAPITAHIQKLESLKNKMLKEEDTNLAHYKKKYDTTQFFTPLMTLTLGMFALVVFVFSFWRINQQRRETKKANSFLENILYNTDNIISFFSPIYNDKGAITDFVIEFTNNAIEPILGQKPKKIEKQLMSQLLPMNFENGIFEELVSTIKDKKPREFETLFEFEEKKIWFFTKTEPLDKGVLTNSRDTSLEHKNLQRQKELTERLEKQNLELLDNRAFLSNIFKSVSEVIMHLKSVRDTEGNIIDFEILFTNEAINVILGDIPNELKNQKLSQTYPDVFKMGTFDKLVTCVEEDRLINYEVPHYQDGQTFWFKSSAIKLNDGVTITSREVTKEKHNTQELIKLNEDLKIQNSILSEAEVIAKMGSYNIKLDSEKFNLSSNFYNIIGYTRKEFEPTFTNFKSILHPEDIDSYSAQHKALLNGEAPNGFIYRIKTKEAKIKYLKTTGHFETRSAKKIFVGVVQDVTDDVKAALKLRNKNVELQRSNAELESFNRVASHDLQEPMRKIQLFISRMAASDKEKLSEKGQLYFDKISSAANRMQNLIKYLLSYSRLNKSKDDFKKVDLQEVIDKVLEDLEELVDESQVKIDLDTLPEIKAIPFQMEQLFGNLLSNAIKYRNKNTQAIIKIECTKISSKNITVDFRKKHKYYYQMAVIDNGIGFDNQYAEKIFGLFERLHHNDAYSGTGIGLAICKKIAENHNGHIAAESDVNSGSTFNVFLPA